ncbi:putative dNA-binding protein [Mycobacterium xenopi 3993]|nr:putative dNA-binding protein [Mycobacterium xenopi 3993]
MQSRLAAAAEAAGRKVDEIELLPITKFFPATDVVILSRLGCTSIGESRDQEASAKVREVARLLGPGHRRCAGTWSAKSNATRRGRWRAGRTPSTPSAACGWRPRSTAP